MALVRSINASAICFRQRCPTAATAMKQLGELLAKIEVEVFDGNRWRHVGTVAEAGPIARDVHLIVLPRLAEGPSVRVRLSMAQGYWKLDQAALAELSDSIAPVRLEVQRITQEGKDVAAPLAALRDESKHLVTYPPTIRKVRQLTLGQLAINTRS